ncbi:hypothetical protein Y032_0010g1162 [Ancylostoma ceylanicum]|uniref:Uncharacterized protein n=1 Tax=Ancylostoma ceylanicum TaxID=53326 RepID=A0A016VGM3_9BILA|nr:hypothetical protein Y032_0010g1162 [Ancylostoma ceylanicum]
MANFFRKFIPNFAQTAAPLYELTKDKFDAAIRQCLVRAQLQNDVLLASIPNHNIKKHLPEKRSKLFGLSLETPR